MQLIHDHLLITLVGLPVVGAAVTLCMPTAVVARITARVSVAVTFVLSLLLLLPPVFDWTQPGIYGYADADTVVQLVLRWEWTKSLRTEFLLGVDGLSLPMVLLTTLLFGLAVLASGDGRPPARQYFATLLLAESAAIGTFLALDLLLIFGFLQATLLAMMALIGIWGGDRRRWAALKFFLYSFVSSAAMLVGIVAIGWGVGSWDVIALASSLREIASADASWATGVFVLLAGAFVVRLATMPLHAWLPDALAVAPTPAGALLAGLLLPIGGYGLLRVVMPLLPMQAQQLWLSTMILAVVSVLAGTLCAMRQDDLKRLFAYHAISQAGLILLGIATMTPAGVGGAVCMMMAHGLTGAAIVFVAGGIEQRVRHRRIDRVRGLVAMRSNDARLAALFIFAGMGLPGMCNFVGMLMVLLGVFAAARSGPLADNASPAVFFIFGAIASLGGALTAALLLRLIQRLYHGLPRSDSSSADSEPTDGIPADSDTVESFVLWALASLVLVIGIMPWATLLMFSHHTITALVKVLGG